MIKFIEQAKSDYAAAYDAVGLEDKRELDLRHDLEFSKSCKERYKISTKFHKCRNDRRVAKDKVEELQPLIDWTNEPETVKVINKLKNTLGAVRKVEAYHTDRQYYPRVM